MHQLINEMKKLKAIRKALNVKKYEDEVYLLSILVAEVAEAIETKGVNYFAHYTSDNYTEHIETYHSIAERNKNKVLSMLQELHQELNKKDVSIKRCNVLVNELIESNFLIVDTEKKISKWQPLRKANFKRQHFTV